MLRSGGFAAAAASLLLAGAFFVVTRSDARAAPTAAGCQDAEFAMLAAPLAPWKGAPLRVLVAAEQAFDGEFALIAPDGSVAAKSHERYGGPPYFWIAEVATPAAGTWHATLARDGASGACGTITREIVVSAQKPPRPSTASGTVWPIRNSWNRATENLFSAWIAKLFDAPLDTEPSWKAWHEVLRDRSRNILFDYLGLGEDNVTISLRPDCADFAYFLRAYFAYKMGLPFGYSNCSRSGKCYQWFNIEHPEATRPPPPPDQITASADPTPAPTLLQQMVGEQAAPAIGAPAKRLGTPSFAEYLRIVGDVVHSGSVRTSATDDNTDFYFVPLTQEALRPGTVYADPYGHVMMVVRRVPESGGAAGILLAVDAEPDGTVARKRFWRGTFLFAHEPTFGSGGFKHFRPIVRGENGALRRLTNAQIAKNPDYGDISPEQSQLAVDDFYDRMDAALSPEPLDPFNAMKEAITALEEQVNTRVTSIENGRKYQDGHGEITMPDGPAIFATTRRLGRFLYAGARFSSLGRDRCCARLSRPGRPAPGTLCHAERQERCRGESRIAKGAGRGTCRPQVFLYAQRRLLLDAHAQGHGRTRRGFRNCLQPQRLRRTALGRAGKQPGGFDLQAPRTVGAAGQDDQLPLVVPRAALAGARLIKARQLFPLPVRERCRHAKG